MTAVSEEARCPSVPDLEALDRLLTTANKEKRTLYEHEGYAAVQAVDLADVPKYRFVPRAGEITPQDLQDLEADRLVIKIVSPEIVHKTEAGGVVFVPNELEAVRSAIARIYESAGLVSSKLVGVLICACVDPPATSLGAELFVGLRMTREFGPVLTAGLGGTDTELLAVALKPPLASATASASLISADGFLELFKRTLGYT
ncbi:MAG: CoA-binding protein, partial [bacterium]|nr:CoA-binding protein [bacterium]